MFDLLNLGAGHQSIIYILFPVLSGLGYLVWLLFPVPRLRRRLKQFFLVNNLVVKNNTRIGKDNTIYPHVYGRNNTTFGFVFLVDLPRGKSVDDLIIKADSLADALGAASVNVVRHSPGVASVTAFLRDATHPIFSLEHLRSKSPFLDQQSLPVGLKDNGSVFFAQMAHLLIVGATGSGKGSAIWSVCMALENRLREGTALLFGIDPKRAELAGLVNAFEAIAYDHSEGLDILNRVVSVMDQRKREGKRSFSPSISKLCFVKLG